MRPRILFALLFLAACIGGVLCTGTADSQDGQQTTRDAEINKLLVERRDTLQQLLNAVTTQYQAGMTRVDNVIRAQDGLLVAELDLAKTSPERIRIHEDRVKNLRDLENAVRQLHAAGRASITDALAAKAARLRAEIALLREQPARQ